MIIIDTYNCVYAGAALGGMLSDLGVRTLCRWIVAQPQRPKTTLVLDGRPKPDEPSENEFPDLNLVYSGTGIPADTVIQQLVVRAGRGAATTVVTDDRALGAAVQRLGAKVRSCDSYLKELTGRRKGSPGAVSRRKSSGTGSPGETQAWLDEFGIGAPPPPAKKPVRNPDPESLDIEDLLGPRQ